MNPLGNPLTPPPTPRFWGSMGAGARLGSPPVTTGVEWPAAADELAEDSALESGFVGFLRYAVIWLVFYFSFQWEQSGLNEIPSMLRPLVLASSRHRHTESYNRDMLMRHRTFNIKVSSTSGLLVAGAPPSLHIWANTSANRSGRSLLDTDTPRIAQMVRLKRFLV